MSRIAGPLFDGFFRRPDYRIGCFGFNGLQERVRTRWYGETGPQKGLRRRRGCGAEEDGGIA
jgi:hypothetical protein